MPVSAARTSGTPSSADRAACNIRCDSGALVVPNHVSIVRFTSSEALPRSSRVDTANTDS